jgi:hypothetical protein
MRPEDKPTSIKVRKCVADMLKQVSDMRDRKESHEHVIIELCNRFMAGAFNGK